MAQKTFDYVTALVIDINNKGSYIIGRFLGHPVLFTPKFHKKGIVYKHKKREERGLAVLVLFVSICTSLGIKTQSIRISEKVCRLRF